jgi:hypothetical protein
MQELESSTTIALLSLLAIGFCETLPTRGQMVKPHRSTDKFHVAVVDENGTPVAGDSRSAAGAHSINRGYKPGDRIEVTGSHEMAVRLDEKMPECLLFLADSAQGKFSYEVPYGRAELQTGSAYAPDSFAGSSHVVTVRPLNEQEKTGYRNLALNPCDVLKPKEGPGQVYPHSSTNSYSRNLYDFAARNAIDGVSENGHHGVWPYQSWGPGLRLDLWWKLDFGRPVDLDKIRLMVRADFPHDSYWKSAVVAFSDGSLVPIQVTDSAEFQEFSFPKRQVSWFRIHDLVPEDPARWCAFIEVEAWGHDLP